MRSLLFFTSLLSLVLGQLSLRADSDAKPRRSHELSDVRSLKLDYSGVRAVVFNVGENKLRIDASPNPQPLLSGYACATSKEDLKKLVLRQERQGDRLVVSLERESPVKGEKEQPETMRDYGWMDLRVSIPLDLAVEVNVTSGDAWVAGAHSLTAKVGSGELEGRRIPGGVTVSVGSGEVELVRVNSIGSGGFDLEGADGDVKIEAIGVGEVDIERVRGSVTLGSLGSGRLEVEDVAGDFTVKTRGHGSIDWRRVSGVVEIPKQP